MEKNVLPLDIENTYKVAIERALEFCKAENYEVAEVILRQLLRCDPEHEEAIHLLGSVRHKLGDYEESLKLFSQLEAMDKDNPEYHNDLGLALSCRGDLNGAIGHLSKALDLTPMEDKPKRAQYLSNMSVQLRRAGLYSEAQIAIRNALDYTEYKDVSVWRNYAALHNELLEVETSIDAYTQMIALQDDPEFHVDLAYALHLKGDLKQAWAEYEHRYKVFPQFGYLFRHYDPAKLWKGEDLIGKTIVVYCEQGLGDTIQFVRYLKHLQIRYWNELEIILHCNERVVSLFKNSNLGISKYIIESPAEPLIQIPEHDYHVSLLSLPHLLGVPQYPMQDYVGEIEPYLKPTHKADLGEKKGLRVGICWAGSPLHPNDARRSVFLKNFEDIASVPGVELFSFQQDKRPRVYKYGGMPVDFSMDANVPFVDLADKLTDVDATAALLKEMDLVISVDTAVLHLAGALGIETWALIPRVPDWRWGLRTSDTDWYPSMLLFRQPQHGDWSSVFAAMKSALKGKVD
jgi:tetratricopeptide (TPR) repeat protein